MVNVDKVKNLLGAGLSQDIVATAVGCTPSYISQLLNDPIFKDEVEKIKQVEATKKIERDSRYDRLEDKFLDQMEGNTLMFRKPRDLLAALKFVNEAKRKSAPEVPAIAEDGKSVNLRLPTVIMNNYKVNIHGTMIEVGGRDLAPMPSGQLIKTLEERRESERTKLLPEKTAESVIPQERIAHESKV